MSELMPSWAKQVSKAAAKAKALAAIHKREQEMEGLRVEILEDKEQDVGSGLLIFYLEHHPHITEESTSLVMAWIHFEPYWVDAFADNSWQQAIGFEMRVVVQHG